MLRFTLTYNSQTVIASEDPVGWQAMQLNYERSPKYFGIFYEISDELGFFCNAGGQLLKDAFEAEGSEADVLVKVDFQCEEGGPFDTIMDGRAKMDTYRVERTNESEIMYVALQNNDLNYKILSRDGIPIDLKSLVGLDGQALTYYPGADTNVELFRKLQITSIIESAQVSYYTGTGLVASTGILHYSLYSPAVTPTQTDLQSVGDIDTQYLFEAANSQLLWFLQYHDLFYSLFTATKTDVQNWPSNLSINFHVQGEWFDNNTSLNRSGEVAFNIYVGPNLFTAYNLGPIYSTIIGSFSATTANLSYPFNISQTINVGTMQEGWGVWAFIFVNNYSSTTVAGGGSNVSFIHQIDNWDFTFTSDNEYPASSADCLLIHEAFSRSLESISGQNRAFYSNLIGRTNSLPYSYPSNGCDAFISVTNGLNVRGKFLEPIETSFADMYDSLDAIANVGLGIEQDPNGGNFSVARLEGKDYFFSNTLILSLSGLINVETQVFVEEIFNEAEVGFDQWQPFSVTGLDEPLTVHSYANRVKNVKNSLNLKSPAIMAMNLIEIIRRYGAQANITQDLSQDENLIFVALNRTVNGGGTPTNLTTAEKNENYNQFISGLTNSTSALNLRYSPARNFIRHMNRLAISLSKFPGSLWRFVAGEGNTAMVTRLNNASIQGCPGEYRDNGLTGITNGRLAENANLAWDDTNIENRTPLFDPVLYNFTHPLTWSEYKQIKANPRGYIQGICANGTVIEGYVKEINYTLERGIATFQLIKRYSS